MLAAAFLLVSMASCKPRKAIALKENIVRKERMVFNMLVGKNGLEEQKLNFLVKNDFQGALAQVDKQEKEFDQLIREIETLPAEGIRQGHELKTAAVAYYTALKELHVFDREEISQREAIQQAGGEALRAAQDKYLELNLQKQDRYKKVYEKERAFYQALEQFNAVNDI